MVTQLVENTGLSKKKPACDGTQTGELGADGLYTPSQDPVKIGTKRNPENGKAKFGAKCEQKRAILDLFLSLDEADRKEVAKVLQGLIQNSSPIHPSFDKQNDYSMALK